MVEAVRHILSARHGAAGLCLPPISLMISVYGSFQVIHHCDVMTAADQQGATDIVVKMLYRVGFPLFDNRAAVRLWLCLALSSSS